MPQDERARILAALTCVDYVTTVQRVNASGVDPARATRYPGQRR